MDLRTFSKGGDLEFYQKEQFIAMTGDGAKTKDLVNFDSCGMKPYLESKCEKRIEWKRRMQGRERAFFVSVRRGGKGRERQKNGDKFKLALYG